VFLGGLECENGGKLIKDLRAGLGTGVLLVAPDGFSSFSDTISHAGAGAAEGMLISIAGQPYANLGADGKAFANAFGKAVLKKPGNAVNPYSNYGATAALTVISALAGSNGTRASFTANLFKTNFKSSPIGAFKLNANGDTNAGVISFYKVTGGKANFEKIISPPASLVAQAKP
jgi:ABC-type branched-subunit amino acid transport system substrate-binding protein